MAATLQSSAFLQGTALRPAAAVTSQRRPAPFQHVRASQRLQGKVVSTKMEKTAVVEVDTLVVHPVYQVGSRRKTAVAIKWAAVSWCRRVMSPVALLSVAHHRGSSYSSRPSNFVPLFFPRVEAREDYLQVHCAQQHRCPGWRRCQSGAVAAAQQEQTLCGGGGRQEGQMSTERWGL